MSKTLINVKQHETLADEGIGSGTIDVTSAILITESSSSSRTSGKR